jgi:hypothetical protein
LTVIEPFSMVRLFRASSYSKYNTNYRWFLELQCMFLFGPRDLVPCPSGGLLTSWLSLGSSCHQLQFPRFVFWTVSNCGYWMGYLSVRPRSNKFHCEQRFGYFKFSCNWRVYCNVNIAFVVLISWMVPRVSMIPVNISYFILLNLHFKISNKYTINDEKNRKYIVGISIGFKRYWKRGCS